MRRRDQLRCSPREGQESPGMSTALVVGVGYVKSIIKLVGNYEVDRLNDLHHLRLAGC